MSGQLHQSGAKESSLIKTSAAVFKLRLKTIFQYRTAAWAGIATQFAFGFMYIMLYTAFFRNGASDTGMTLSEAVSYAWLRQAFLGFAALWIRDSEINESIISGQVAYELCRPVGLYELWYAKSIAQRIGIVSMRGGILILVGVLLPSGIRLNLPPSIPAMLLFIVSMTIGVLLVTAVTMTIYALMLKTMSMAGSFGVVALLGDFFSGMIMPIAFFPDWLAKIAYYTPFGYYADLPFRIWAGNIPPDQALPLIGVQLIWLAVMVALGKLIFAKFSRKLVVQGG